MVGDEVKVLDVPARARFKGEEILWPLKRTVTSKGADDISVTNAIMTGVILVD